MMQDDISIRPLSAALRKKAEEELNETPEKIVTHLKILQDWIKTQPDLQKMKTNQWLIAFLRGCKYDVEKAKGKLKICAQFKANIPELYGNRDPFDPGIQEILQFGVFLPLRKTKNEDDPRICLNRSGPYSLTQGSLVDFLKLIIMIIEILLIEDDQFVVAGVVHKDLINNMVPTDYSFRAYNNDRAYNSLSDLRGMGFGFILQWTPSLARKMMTCIEKAMSVRIKSLQILDPPYGLSIAMAIFKMFTTAKIKNRIFMHSKDSLYNYIDKSVLPEEYGGTDGKLQEHIDYWKEKVESYRDWFLDGNNEDSSQQT